MYFDINSGYLSEKDLRVLLLDYELSDIKNNEIEYVDRILDIKAQCKCLENAINEPIERVVESLNTLWGCDFEKVVEK